MKDLDVNTLPGPERLNSPGIHTCMGSAVSYVTLTCLYLGHKDGQTLMINNGGKAFLYQWEASSRTWKEVGEIVGAKNKDEKKKLNGIEYDHVFDVDIGDGGPLRKLGYNNRGKYLYS